MSPDDLTDRAREFGGDDPVVDALILVGALYIVVAAIVGHTPVVVAGAVVYVGCVAAFPLYRSLQA